MTAAADAPRLSARVRRVGLSPVAAAGARAAALTAQGRDILVLTAGEPDFDTPEPIKRAAVAALARGVTKYTPTPGTLALRRAIGEKYRRERGLDYPPAEVIVGAGAKQVIFNAMAATLDAGDEVVVPAPYWPSFPDIVRVNDGTPVVVRTGEAEGFKIGAQALERAIGPRTRWLILNSPANPTGAVYGRDELASLAEVLRRHPDVWVLWDEVYEHIWFTPDPPAHLLEVAPDLRGRTLLVNGASKTWAMTGWRIGWGAGPRALVEAMAVIQSQATSGANAVGQAAVTAALGAADPHFVERARRAYAARASRTARRLVGIEGLTVVAPQGAFFVYVGVRGLLGRALRGGGSLGTDADVAQWLLESAGVAVVAGEAYGLSPYVRVSIAASEGTLEEAAARIGNAVAALDGPVATSSRDAYA